jgi:hypothetical protein
MSPGETPLNPEMFPESPNPESMPDRPIDTTFDRDALIASAPISEAVPVLLGLRTFINERRIARAQRQVERLATTQRVVGLVGRSIIKDSTITPTLARVYGLDRSLVNKGYMHEDNPLRPTSLQEHRLVKRLSKVTGKRRVNQNMSGHLAASYPDVVGSEQTLSPLFNQTGKKLSIGERRHLGKNARHHRVLQRKMARQDKRFAKTVSLPARKAQKHAERRDKLVIKQAAVERAKSR